MNLKAVWELIRDTFKDWSEDKAARLGAALAYYTVFAIGPLLVIVIAIAGLVFEAEAAERQVIGTIRSLVGQSGSELIEQTIENANKGGENVVASAFGIGILLFGAAGVFGQLKDALNTIWEVKPKPNAGVLGMVRERFLSFTMVLGTGFLLLVSLVLSAGITALSTYLQGILPGSDLLWQILNIVFMIVVVTVMFALLYKYLPDVKIAWKDVWLGAFVTTLLFLAGQLALGIYLGSGSVGSAFGAASSLVVILVWVYYSAQIFFFGAEFTQVYAHKYGSRLQPKEYAEFATEEARAQEGLTRKEGDEGKEGERRAQPRLKESPWFN
jgi:membrane protein